MASLSRSEFGLLNTNYAEAIRESQPNCFNVFSILYS